mgnify:CR=1 FL=1
MAFIIISSFILSLIMTPWSYNFYLFCLYLLFYEFLYLFLFRTTANDRMSIVVAAFFGWLVGRRLWGCKDIYDDIE